MSGGKFSYLDGRLKDEIFGWEYKPLNVFEDREISELVWDVLNLIHAFDLYQSCDTVKEIYLKAKAEFKKKWMSNRGVRIRRIVDEAVKQLKDELYETFGLEEEKQYDPAANLSPEVRKIYDKILKEMGELK